MTTRGENANCTFCDLIQGSAEVSICYEDADAIAFMDIQPVNNGHVLVVPRAHYESLLDVPQEIGMHVFQITMRLANAVRSVTGCNDMNIVVNSGTAAGQDEPHYHVHIIPRRVGDGFEIELPFNGSEMPDRTLLDAYAARIGSALSDPMKISGAAGSSGAGRERAAAASPKTLGQDAQPGAGVDASASDTASGTASDGASAAASAPQRMQPVQRVPERAVALPTFVDSKIDSNVEPEHVDASPTRAPGMRRAGRFRVNEGAHGELTYEMLGDAPGVT